MLKFLVQWDQSEHYEAKLNIFVVFGELKSHYDKYNENIEEKLLI
jgi:hypothetical protein